MLATIDPTPMIRPVPTTTVPIATPLRAALRSAKLAPSLPATPKTRNSRGLRSLSTGPRITGAASDTPARKTASARHTTTRAVKPSNG